MTDPTSSSPFTGYRNNLEVLGELEYDPDSPDEWTTDQIVVLLKSRSCAPDAPWSGSGWGDDHGHTDCWVHGQAAKKLEALEAELVELRSRFDLEGV